jgi:CRP/FNR family cyclic AMP-dependent transcriptional regulator
MKVPNKISVQHKCSDCSLHSESFFCELTKPALLAFESLKITNTYPKGGTLFNQGHPSNGIYMLCQGKVKMCAYSRDGRTVILRVAEAGEVLGLSSVVSNTEFEATAEVIEDCQVNFVRKSDFLRFLEEHSDAALNAIRQLSHNYHAAFTQVRSLALSATVADKLARLFLDWSRFDVGHSNGNGVIHLKLKYTHEEIAAMIGTSRETVTRLMNDLRRKNVIDVKGSDLYINDKSQLESIIGSRQRGAGAA